LLHVSIGEHGIAGTGARSFSTSPCAGPVLFFVHPMADAVFLPSLANHDRTVAASARHSAVVRVTHWIHTASFFALVVSGIAILVAHPRLYWGETGTVGTPALIDLPLPFVFGHSGWGRYLHFLSAWVFVFTGSVYVLNGLFNQHFRTDLLPSKAALAWGHLWRVVLDHLRLKRPADEASRSYNVLQRLAYLGVVFVLSPLVVVTGLAMSPAITSVVPALVTGFGGHQSARTIHFLVAGLLVLFLLVHVAMVCRAGFRNRMRAMITGRNPARREPA
jgi:thiosulfate reductase cytochrome b subunit